MDKPLKFLRALQASRVRTVNRNLTVCNVQHMCTFNSSYHRAVVAIVIVHMYGTWPVAVCQYRK